MGAAKAGCGDAGDAVAGATVFLILMASLHVISKSVVTPFKLPFLAYSDTYWEFMKVGIYASTISYLLLWAVRGRGYLVGLSACVLATVFSMFLYGYAISSFIGAPLSWRYSILAIVSASSVSEAMKAVIYLGVMLGLTWVSGLIGSYVGVKAERFKDSDPLAVVGLISYSLLLWLSIISTYVGPPPPLFTTPQH